MKYKVGDKLVFDRYGTIQACEVVTVIEKTGRYRIKYPSSWNEGKDCTELKKTFELFATHNDCINSQIINKECQIEQIKKDIQNLNEKRIKVVSEAK